MAASKGWKDAQNFYLDHNDFNKEFVCKKIADILNGQNLNEILEKLRKLKEDTLKYDEESREVFKLCYHYINGFSDGRILNIDQFKDANSTFVKEVGKFLYCYANEERRGKLEKAQIYMKIKFKPARKRAEQLGFGLLHRNEMYIETKDNIKIPMPENPTKQEYITFVIKFLSNIYNF